MSKKAMKLALEALEAAISDDKPYIVLSKEAIIALREALTSVPDWASEAIEQPAQQPAQQEPVGYEKYAAIREGHRNACEEAYFGARPDLPLATSTLTAFRHGFDRGYDVEGKQHRNEWLIQLQDEIKRLQLASPPAQRTWVGLTDEELDEMFSKTLKGKKLVNWVAQAIEAKLKEKNHV